MAGTQYELLTQATVVQPSRTYYNGNPQLTPAILAIPWNRKFSTLTTLATTVSFVAVPAVVPFLCFLWMSPHGDHAKSIWLRLILSNWLLRIITISALLIRTATSTLAAVATSILACIILERRGVTLHTSAPMSAIRFINAGPQSLLFALYGTFSHAHIWAWSAVLLFCTTMLLQFSSTALVADLGIGTLTIASQKNSTLTGLSFQNFNFSDIRSVQPTPYWSDNIQSFPTFAEYHDDVLNESKLDAVRDTGTTLRAFVPFGNSQERTSIRDFMGAATVLDSRVTCVRPQTHDGLSIGLTESGGWFMNGSLIPEVAPPGLILSNYPAVTQDLNPLSFNVSSDQNNQSSRIELNWSQQLPTAHYAGEWNFLQKIMYQGPALVSTLDPRYPGPSADRNSAYSLTNPNNWVFTLSYFSEKDPTPLMTGQSYVVLNVSTNPNMMTTSINATDYNGANGAFFSTDQELNNLVIKPENEWLRLAIPRVPDFELAVSLCFDSFVSADAQVNISSEFMTEEPSISVWDPFDQTFNTSTMRHQLGVASSQAKDHANRNIMKLHSSPEQLRYQVEQWYNQSKTTGFANISFPTQNFVALSTRSTQTSGTVLCAACGMGNENMDLIFPSIFQRQMFQTTTTTTGDISLAFQAYYTVLGRMAYYDTFQFFDQVDHPVVSWFQYAQFPQSFHGLAAVVIVLFAHLFVVLLILLFFLGTTKASYIGDNAWQSLGQMHSIQMDEAFAEAATGRDSTIKKRLAAAGMGNDIVSLGLVDSRTSGQKIALKRSKLRAE